MFETALLNCATFEARKKIDSGRGAVTNSSKGLAKLENIVAETLLQTQLFPSLAARENVAGANFAS